MAGTKSFQRRTGFAQFPRWRGVNKQGSPSNIDPNELRDGININLSGGEMGNRGGQSKLSPDSLTGCPIGIHDHILASFGVKLYLLNPSLYTFDQEDTPNFQTVAVQEAGSDYNYFNGGMVSYQDRLHFIVLSHLYQLQTVQIPTGEDAGGIGGLKRAVEVATFDDDISFMAVMPTTLADADSIFLGAMTDGVVRSWDGTSVREDSASLGSGAQLLATYHEDLFVFGTNYAKKRDGGTYTAVAMPGGLTSFQPLDATIYGDTLYIAGRDDAAGPVYKPTILAYDGTSLTIARQPSDAGSVHEAHEGVFCLAVQDELLFYGWKEMTLLEAHVGMYDGATWDDDHKNLATDIPLSHSTTCMVSHQGSLFAATIGSLSLAQSPGSDTQGTWTAVATLEDEAGDMLEF